jgi:hypothetical protein
MKRRIPLNYHPHPAPPLKGEENSGKRYKSHILKDHILSSLNTKEGKTGGASSLIIQKEVVGYWIIFVKELHKREERLVV